MSRRVRVGVVGVGWWATQFHLPALLGNPWAEVTCLADPNPERLQAARRHFGVAHAFADAHDLFASGLADAVVIATPHVTHYTLVKAALERGLHALCEKPFVLESRQGHELLKIARERSLHLMVGYTYQFTHHARTAREWVLDGRVGDLLFVSGLFASMVEAFYRGRTDEYDRVFHYPMFGPDSRTYSDPKLSGGGQAQTQITHAMNMVFWVTGRRAAEVSALMINRDLPVDLADAISYRLDNGAIGTMGSTGSLRPGQPQQQEIRYYGTKGCILQELIHGKLAWHGNDGTTESLPDLVSADVYPAAAVTAGLIDLIRGNGDNPADAATAVATVEFIEAAYRSAASRAPEMIDPSPAAASHAADHFPPARRPPVEP
ncbi:MAG TPA: Gfo/Idh/MocA family oxidoreductase [Steroidobacteraceae bacterium]|jgi:predicted dehydrogenase|nr:Gfo/Idh/MocA family oxidoreductase [Steroidobacteraceae bacterium]